MKEDKYTEKLFLEYLDRLLAGEDIKLGDDVPDEVRSALEHARKMLALRQEPSPAFRADLRDKLLRQMAAQSAPEERMASAFPLRPVLIGLASTVAVVLLAFVGVVWFGGRGGAPTATLAPAVAPPTAEYSVRLPANIVPPDISFTAQTSLSANPSRASIYKVDISDITTQYVTALGHKLGFTGQASLSHDGTKITMSQGSGDEARQLTVWTASGAIEYRYVEPQKLYPPYRPELPSQSEAELIAYDFLQQADLLPPGYHSLAAIKDETNVVAGGGYSVGQPSATEAGPPAAAAPSAPSLPWQKTAPSPTPAPLISTYWVVGFPYFINGTEAAGPGSMIDVSIGDKGQVVGVLSSWRPVSPLGTDNIISEQQAFQDLIQGKGSLEVPVECKQVVVDKVQLKYWLDPPSEKQDYAVPVYEFTGKCLDKNGRTLESFTGWTPALSETN
jgi:hypothetical protein